MCIWRQVSLSWFVFFLHSYRATGVFCSGTALHSQSLLSAVVFSNDSSERILEFLLRHVWILMATVKDYRGRCSDGWNYAVKFVVRRIITYSVSTELLFHIGHRQLGYKQTHFDRRDPVSWYGIMSQVIDHLSPPPAQACFCPSTFKVISGKQVTETRWALHHISKGEFCNSRYIFYFKNPLLRCSIWSWRCDVLGGPCRDFSNRRFLSSWTRVR